MTAYRPWDELTRAEQAEAARLPKLELSKRHGLSRRLSEHPVDAYRERTGALRTYTSVVIGRDKALSLIRRSVGAVSTEAVAEHLGCCPRTARRRLAELADEGKVFRTGRGWLFTPQRARLLDWLQQQPTPVTVSETGRFLGLKRSQTNRLLIAAMHEGKAVPVGHDGWHHIDCTPPRAFRRHTVVAAREMVVLHQWITTAGRATAVDIAGFTKCSPAFPDGGLSPIAIRRRVRGLVALDLVRRIDWRGRVRALGQFIEAVTTPATVAA